MKTHLINLNYCNSLKTFKKSDVISAIINDCSRNFKRNILFSDSERILDGLKIDFSKFTYHKFIKERLNIDFANFHTINKFFEEKGLPKFVPFQMIDFIDLLDNDHIYGKINLYRVLDNLRDFPYDIAYDFDIETAEKYLNWLKENKIVDYLEGLKLAEEMIKTSNIEQYEAIFVYPAERISIYHWKFLKALRPKYLYLLGSLKNDVIGLTNSWANEIDIITEAFNSFKSLTESHVEIEDIKEISSLKPDIIVVNTLKDALELSEKLKEINCHHSIIFKNILTPKLNAVWKAFLAITRENSTLEEVLPFLNYLPSKILPFKKEKFLSAIKTNPINKAKISLYPIIHKTILNLFKNNDLPTIFKLINWGPEDKKIWSLIRTAPHLWYEPSLTITTATRLSTRIDDFVSKSLNLGNYLVNKFPIVNNTLNIVYIVNFVEKNEEEKRINRSNY